MRSSAIVLLTYAISVVCALNPIVTKGSKFFDSVTKQQFFVKGVAYQPRGQIKDGTTDPLADPVSCARDAPLMAKLGTNVLRVYEVDPRRNHDACMKSFADAGIYLILDVATPHYSVNRKTPEYSIDLYNAYKSTIDAFAKYDNLFAFIAGNEVTNDKTNTPASAFVKASLRDIKNYVRSTKRREIPVGYASNDDEYIRESIKNYFNCGDEESQADFFGVNLYEWCGESTFEKSGYKDRTKEFEGYSKPIFFSEYGCNLVNPRTFSEVAALYGPEMSDIWSGGIVYEWTQENNRYGLVNVNDQGSAELLPDYHNLQAQMAKINPISVHMDQFNEQRAESVCPPITDNWKASITLPPTPSDGACKCMVENLGCVASNKVILNARQMNDSASIGVQLDTMCGLVSCLDISSNAETGDYGAFSFCGARDKLSWLYDLQAKQLKTCHYEGLGQEVVPRRNDLRACSAIAPKLDGPSTTSSFPSSATSSTDLYRISILSFTVFFLTTFMIL